MKTQFAPRKRTAYTRSLRKSLELDERRQSTQDPEQAGQVQNEEAGFSVRPDGAQGYLEDGATVEVPVTDETAQRALEGKEKGARYAQAPYGVPSFLEEHELMTNGQHSPMACRTCIRQAHMKRNGQLPKVDVYGFPDSKSWSKEALANQVKLEAYIKSELEKARVPISLAKSYSSQSLNLKDNALWHSMGLIHNMSSCPRCRSGEEFKLCSFYKTEAEIAAEYYDKTGRSPYQ